MFRWIRETDPRGPEVVDAIAATTIPPRRGALDAATCIEGALRRGGPSLADLFRSGSQGLHNRL